MSKRKNSKIDRELIKMVNSLTADQMTKIYDIVDGPIPSDIAKLSDDELLAELGA